MASSRSDCSGLTYEVHTGRELEFMLTRGKPLAHFSDAYPAEANEEIFPENAFAPYVESGVLLRRELVELSRQGPEAHSQGIRHLLYARASEAWRIDAYISMMAAAAKAGWSEGFERLQGSLLGYEEWQTDVHLSRLRARMRADANTKSFPWLQR